MFRNIACVSSFAMTFGAMFLSLLPDLLLSFQVPEERIWFDSSAAMFVYSAGFVYWMVTRALHVAKSSARDLQLAGVFFIDCRTHCRPAVAARHNDWLYRRAGAWCIYPWPNLVPCACCPTICSNDVYFAKEYRSWLKDCRECCARL